jgi:hypothetical protein
LSTAFFCFVVFPPHKIFLLPPSACTKSKSTKKPKRSRRHHRESMFFFARSASSSSSSLLSFLLKSTTTTTTTSRIKRGSETTRKTIQKYYSSSTTFDRSGETISRDMRRKDLAEETRYFAHEDYELLRKLARKAKRSADEVNPEHGQKLRETERRELAKLVPSLRDGDLTKILNWLHKDGTGTRA